MKKNLTFFVLFLSIIAFVITFFAACSKDSLKEDTTAATDNSIGDQMYDDALTQVSTSEEDLFSGKKRVGTCPSVTITSGDADVNNWPKTITIDFGSAGCTGVDGVFRKGMITVTLTGRIRTPGSVWTITFNGYTVDNYIVEGNYVYSNTTVGNSNPTFSMILTGGKITKPDNSKLEFGCNRVKTWSQGSATLLDLSDDIYKSTGTAQLTQANGTKWNGEYVSDPLVTAPSCGYIMGGSLKITSGIKVIMIDYGNEVCDDKAKVTVNGVYETEIDLDY